MLFLISAAYVFRTSCLSLLRQQRWGFPQASTATCFSLHAHQLACKLTLAIRARTTPRKGRGSVLTPWEGKVQGRGPHGLQSRFSGLKLHSLNIKTKHYLETLC